MAPGALGPGAVAGEEHDTDVGRAAGVVEHPVELVDGVWPERVEHLGPVERHAHAAQAHGSVVGDVGEVLETGHLLPGVGVEGLADTGDRAHGGKASPSVARRRPPAVQAPPAGRRRRAEGVASAPVAFPGFRSLTACRRITGANCPAGGHTEWGRRPAHASWSRHFSRYLALEHGHAAAGSPRPDGQPRRTSRGSELRPEIQAMRALAVLAVLLFHLWPNRLTGGYVGVDVFFVISGYLITSHLLAEVVHTGQAPPRPVLGPPGQAAAAGVAARAVHHRRRGGRARAGRRWPQFLTEVSASALYVQNWLLAANSVDYLAAAGTHRRRCSTSGPSRSRSSSTSWCRCSCSPRPGSPVAQPGPCGRAALVTVAGVTVASFGYSIWLTADRGARVVLLDLLAGVGVRGGRPDCVRAVANAASG